jgi:PBP1b-binding outer membrane lipoprotein LpoB
MNRNSTAHRLLLISLAILLFNSCFQAKEKETNQQSVRTDISDTPQTYTDSLSVPVLDTNVLDMALVDLPGDIKVRIDKGMSLMLEMDGVSLSAPDTAIIRKGTYTVTALTTE